MDLKLNQNRFQRLDTNAAWNVSVHPREVAMSIYDNPKYFPPYDSMETGTSYSVPNTASGTDCALIVDLVG